MANVEFYVSYLLPFESTTPGLVRTHGRSHLSLTFVGENPNTINGLLKGELGFQGLVMSDWGAQVSFRPFRLMELTRISTQLWDQQSVDSMYVEYFLGHRSKSLIVMILDDDAWKWIGQFQVCNGLAIDLVCSRGTQLLGFSIDFGGAKRQCPAIPSRRSSLSPCIIDN